MDLYEHWTLHANGTYEGLGVEGVSVVRERTDLKPSERAALETIKSLRQQLQGAVDALRVIQWGEMGACPACNGFYQKRPHDENCIVRGALTAATSRALGDGTASTFSRVGRHGGSRSCPSRGSR